LTISNNSAVASASYYLDKNQKHLQDSIKRLASGKKIVGANEDPGTLSVAMKLNAAVNRLSGAKNNVQNGISFVEIQDGVLETVGRIVGRMAELKGMATQDPLKSSQDVESYNNEFADLQKQLFDVSKTTFNGVSLFANFVSDGNGGSGTTQTQFKGSDSLDHTIDIFTSSEGSSGTKVSLYKSALLSALTIDASDLTTAQDSAAGASGTTFGLFLDSSAGGTAITLNATGLSMGVFEQAVSNIAYLRAQSGGGMSRLSFAADSISSMETNLRAAIGRIEDVDIAAESANLAKYSILTQASAAMVAQANNSNDLALMLLR
ncbi:MAG TPA: flagellin, partial [Opitutae bacterium]|nr:flagellin [Opitutae bacterium]